MKIIDLNQLGWGIRSHLSALWWLGLLYRRPRLFDENLVSLDRLSTGIKVGALCWHIVPYTVILGMGWRYLIVGILGLQAELAISNPHLGFFFIAIAIPLGVAIGIALNFVFCIAIFIPLIIDNVITSTRVIPIILLLILLVLFILSLTSILSLYNPDTFNGNPDGIAFFTAVLIGILISVLRLHNYPIHLLSIWPRVRLRWFNYHPAIWEEACFVPYKGLHRLLVAKAVADPFVGNRHIDYLIDH